MRSEKELQQRFQLLTKWLNIIMPYQDISQIAGDASFRRYYRVEYVDRTLIAVDAPPELEDSHPFVAVAKIFENAGLCVPHIIHADLHLGFMLISDLGDKLYFRVLNEKNADELYSRAIKKLHIIQTCLTKNHRNFPVFSHALLSEELTNFQRWYLETHLQLSLNDQHRKLLAETFSLLVKSALAQPQVCVHRDYHSRNLLVLPKNEVGIIDFQDAVWGPISYDLVSLIKDCYIDWPTSWVEKWLKQYHSDATQLGALTAISYDQFKRWFDWMGIQRHLKAIFIFARKWHRDQNQDYLHDIPRSLNYIMDATALYPELLAFRELLAFSEDPRGINDVS